MKFKPMLAGKLEAGENLDTISYPKLVSRKLDGVRAEVQGGRLVSRKLKLIPNRHVQKLFGRREFEGLDGELICGDPTDKNAFQKTMSAVMSEDGKPDVTYYVFDRFGDEHFIDRLDAAAKVIHKYQRECKVRLVLHVVVRDEKELLKYEKQFIAEGYEGIMLRDPDGPYKEGRSSVTQGWLLKLKRFEDSEAKILDCNELFHNTNQKVRDELGHSKRSSHQDGLVAGGKLGSFDVRDIHTGVEFSMSGFDDAQRKDFWKRRKEIVGKVVKYKFQPTGVKDKPRFPIFLGFRDSRDM